MKKTLIAFSTVGFLLTGVAGNAFADGVDPVAEETESQEGLDLVNLTLDTVIQRALEDDSNLLLLSYRLDLLGDQERIAENDIDDYEDKMDKPGSIFQERLQYDQARDSLLDALEQLPYQERTLILNQESTKEAVKSMMTSSYVGLLSLEDQISLSEQSLEWLKEDLKVVKLQNEVGLASLYDVRDLERESENLERTIEDSKISYENELLKLLVNLNIPYSEDITLASINETEVEVPERPENIAELIENAYQMQTAKENVKIAELTLEQQWYDGLMTRKNNQVSVDEAKLNVTDTETELTKKINTLYDNAESKYLAYQDKLRALSYAEEDQERLNLQYDVGLVSEYEYDKIERSLKQKQVELELAELEYFTLLDQIDALQRGYIQ